MAHLLYNLYFKYKSIIKQKSRFFCLLLFIITSNAALFTLHFHHDFISEINEFTPKARELINMHIPSSNFYPIGPALLYAPWLALGAGTFSAIVFYFNVGTLFYGLICNKIKSNIWFFVAIFGYISNIYFFIYLLTSEDTVFQFSALISALYFLIDKKFFPFFILSILACIVRSTDVFVIIPLSIIFSFGAKQKRWLATPALYLLIMAFNWTHYGSPAPSLNGGYNVFLGQNRFYLVAHPKFDIDVFFEKHSLNAPGDVSTRPNKDLQLNNAYFHKGIENALASKSRFALSSLLKSMNWLLNVEVVPSSGGLFSLEKLNSGRYVINMDQPPLDGEYTEDFIYTIYKIIYNILFLLAALYVLISAYYKKYEPFSILITPIFLTLPIIMLTFPDTRFKIVYEICAIPAICVYAPRLFRVIMAGSRSADFQPTPIA